MAKHGSGVLKTEFVWIFAETCNSLSPFYKRLKTIKSAVITSEIQGERGNQIPKPYLNSKATIQAPTFAYKFKCDNANSRFLSRALNTLKQILKESGVITTLSNGTMATFSSSVMKTLSKVALQLLFQTACEFFAV